MLTPFPKTFGAIMRYPLIGAAIFLVAIFAILPVSATSAFGYFDEPFDIQFVGGTGTARFDGVVEVSMRQGPKRLPKSAYRLSGYAYGRSLRLVYENPHDPALPPSFVLKATGKRAMLTIGGETYRGEFRWRD